MSLDLNSENLNGEADLSGEELVNNTSSTSQSTSNANSSSSLTGTHSSRRTNTSSPSRAASWRLDAPNGRGTEKKGRFTKDEKLKIIEALKIYKSENPGQIKKWSQIRDNAAVNRTTQQVYRFCSRLETESGDGGSHKLKRALTRWTEFETSELKRLQALNGNKWSAIAKEMPKGETDRVRTANDCQKKFATITYYEEKKKFKRDKFWRDEDDQTLIEKVREHHSKALNPGNKGASFPTRGIYWSNIAKDLEVDKWFIMRRYYRAFRINNSSSQRAESESKRSDPERLRKEHAVLNCWDGPLWDDFKDRNERRLKKYLLSIKLPSPYKLKDLQPGEEEEREEGEKYEDDTYAGEETELNNDDGSQVLYGSLDFNNTGLKVLWKDSNGKLTSKKGYTWPSDILRWATMSLLNGKQLIVVRCGDEDDNDILKRKRESVLKNKQSKKMKIEKPETNSNDVSI